MVRLAKEMESKPFHLIASDCQDSKKEDVLLQLKSNGYETDTQNFTITQFGGHEFVKGNGFAPYYILFDHRGKVFYHYKAGGAHGGDGLKFLELTKQLIEDAPIIYTGRKLYVHITALADQVAKKQQLPTAIESIRKRIIDGTESQPVLEELQRLYDRIKKYRDQRLKAIDKMMGTNPDKVLGELKTLQNDFKGTTIADSIEDKMDAMKNSKELKEAIEVQKKWIAIQTKISLLKPCESCKKKASKSMNDSCSSCQKANQEWIQKLAQQMEKDLEGKDHLVITQNAKKFMQQLMLQK